MAKEDWKLCVEWLVRCQILTPDHKLAREDAQVFDLAQFVRDGVLLCHLLNHLCPGCISTKDFSQRPQMSQVCYTGLFTFTWLLLFHFEHYLTTLQYKYKLCIWRLWNHYDDMVLAGGFLVIFVVYF